MNLNANIETAELPDPADTVLEIEYKEACL